ncbi:MAG TPA: lysylphosphatidylglycerol synthase transmembrane domain-containing protein [Chitinophagaceae bacterium]|nr:lysylphosphatidylglycerol synthase transmembrane domain-containing protein [Chitinophagaceae bacterium]
MNRPVAGILKFALFLGLGIGLIWLATHNLTAIQRRQGIQAFRTANYMLLIPALLAGLASHITRAARWKLLILPLGYNPSLINVFCAVMIGYLGNLAFPRLGEITRCAVLARHERLPANQIIGTMITERAVDALSLLVLLTATIAFQFRILGAFFHQEILVRLTGLFHLQGNSWIFWLSGFLLFTAGLVWYLLARLKHTLLGLRLHLLLKGVWEGMRSIRNMRNRGLFIMYTLLLWTLYFGMVYIGFYTLKSTSSLSLGACFSVLAFGSIGMILTQGGIGAYQLMVEQTLVLYGTGSALAYALGWIIWSTQTLLIVIGGFFCVVLLPLINRQTPGQAADHHP